MTTTIRSVDSVYCTREYTDRDNSGDWNDRANSNGMSLGAVLTEIEVDNNNGALARASDIIDGDLSGVNNANSALSRASDCVDRKLGRIKNAPSRVGHLIDRALSGISDLAGQVLGRVRKNVARDLSRVGNVVDQNWSGISNLVDRALSRVDNILGDTRSGIIIIDKTKGSVTR